LKGTVGLGPLLTLFCFLVSLLTVLSATAIWYPHQRPKAMGLPGLGLETPKPILSLYKLIIAGTLCYSDRRLTLMDSWVDGRIFNFTHYTSVPFDFIPIL
jgi:hypothetical protein